MFGEGLKAIGIQGAALHSPGFIEWPPSAQLSLSSTSPVPLHPILCPGVLFVRRDCLVVICPASRCSPLLCSIMAWFAGDFRGLALSNGNKWLIDYLISKVKCPETNQSHHYMTGSESSSIQKTPDVFKQSWPTSALHLSTLRTLERIREPPSTETTGPAIPSHPTWSSQVRHRCPIWNYFECTSAVTKNDGDTNTLLHIGLAK